MEEKGAKEGGEIREGAGAGVTDGRGSGVGEYGGGGDGGGGDGFICSLFPMTSSIYT